MVTENGSIAPPEGGFVTATQTLAYPVVSLVVYVVESNPTSITKIYIIIEHKIMEWKLHTVVIVE